MKRTLTRAAAIVFGLGLLASPASAIVYTFGGYTFDQADTTDVIGLLGDGVNLGGAQFSSGLPTRITRSVGFGSDPSDPGNENVGFNPLAGWVTQMSLGEQAHLQQGLTQSDGTGSLFSSAVNLPDGNDGTDTRHGLELSWSGGRALGNGAGDDFVIYESGSGGAGGEEGFMARVRTTGGSYTDWFFQRYSNFQLYDRDPMNSDGVFATAFDLDLFGLGAGDEIDLIQIANLMETDTLADGTANGTQVLFDGTGDAHGFSGSKLDPDPVYIGVLQPAAPPSQPAPEPTILLLLLPGVAGLLVANRRKR